MTALQIIQDEYRARPNRSLMAIGCSKKTGGEQCIGGWNHEIDRLQIVASKTLTGEWVAMPYELLVNGLPMVELLDWRTVYRPEVSK